MSFWCPSLLQISSWIQRIYIFLLGFDPLHFSTEAQVVHFWLNEWKLHICVQLFVTPWTIRSMDFSRPEYWSGWPFPFPGDLPNPEIEPRSPTLQANSLPAEPQGKPNHQYCSDFSTPASDSLFPMEMVQTLAWHTSLLSGSSLLFYPVSLRPFPSISAPLVSADKSNLHRIWLSLSSLTLCLSLQNKIFLFIWLCWVLVVTCRIFFQLQHVGSNFLTRNQTQAPCIGNAES